MAKEKPMKVGDRRFYPPHGVVSLIAVEEREFGGNREKFNVLELISGGTILLPSKTVPEVALRPLISAAKAKTLLGVMTSKKKPTVDPALDNKERASLYAEQLNKGDPTHYTNIFRDLAYRAKWAKISSSEQRFLELARTYFIGEVGSVLKKDPQQLQANVDAAIERLSPTE